MAVTPARLGKLRLKAGRLNFVAPTSPHTPTPAHTARAGPLTLQWLCAGGQSYDVYFGTTAAPPFVGTTPQRAWVVPPLTPETIYYWRVVARANPLGAAVSGPVWHFTAAVPVAPVLVSPPHHSTNQPTALSLVWSQPLTVPGDIVFNVYFGPTPSAPLVQRRQTATTYTPATLRDGVDYYWRIVAINNVGATSGPTWTFETRNPTKGLITIGGVDVRGRTRLGDLRIRDLLNVPNTCQLTVDGSAPTLAKEVRIGLATLAGDDVLFGGFIDTVEAVYEGRPENRAWHVTCQDYVYGIDRKKVRRRYTQQSATLIAQDLLTRDAPAGYTGTQIQAGLPVVSGGIDFTEEDLAVCFARLAQRIGGYWYVDYARDVHLFLTEAVDAPTPITVASRALLDEPPITWEADLTQVRTRVFVEGGGSQARSLVAVGATSLPVTDASWYASTGGLVVSGPQRIRYTGKGTVGGPAAPSATGQAVVGALGGGPYSYVITQIIAGAESPLSGPSPAVLLPAVASPPPTLALAPFFSGIPAPATSPTVAPFASGVGPPTTQLAFTWAATHVPPPPTAPTVTAATTIVPPPPTGPTVTPLATGVPPSANPPSPAAAYTGIRAPTGAISAVPALPTTGHVDVSGWYPSITIIDVGTGGIPPWSGNYEWVFTATNAKGETTASVAAAVNGSMPQPSNVRVVVPNMGNATITSTKIYRRLNGAPYQYVGTLPGSGGGTFIDNVPPASLGANPPATNTTGTPGGGSMVPGGYYIYNVRFGTSSADTETSPNASSVALAGPPTSHTAAQLSTIPTSPDGRVTKRTIWRSKNGGGTLYFLATISDNVTTTYLDTKADSGLGVALSNTNTTGSGGLVAGQVYHWAVTFVTSSGETMRGQQQGLTLPSGYDAAALTAIPTSPDGRVTARKLYRARANSGSFYLETTLNDNVTTSYTSTKPDAQLGALAPTLDTSGPGGLIPGNYYAWGCTFVTATGETPLGAWTPQTLPTTADTAQLSALPIAADPRVTKRKLYRWTGVNWFLVVTLDDNATTVYTDAKTDAQLGAVVPTTNTSGSGGLVPGGYYAWACSFVTASGETQIGVYGDVGMPANCDTAHLSNVPIAADPRVTARKVYRTKIGGGTFYYLATINDNVTTTHTDATKTDAQLGAASPTANTSGTGGLVVGRHYSWTVTFVTATGETTLSPWSGQWTVPPDIDQMLVSAIPAGPAGVIARRLYRTTYSGTGWDLPWKLVTTLNDNVTASYLDAKTDGQLGKDAPPANTTGGGGLVPGTGYTWVVTFGTASAETTSSPWAGLVTMPALCDMATLTLPLSNDPRTTRRKLYRWGPGGVWQFEATINDNSTTTFTSSKADGALGATGLPPVNTTGTGALVPGLWYGWTVKYGTATGESGEAPTVGFTLPAGMDSVALSGIPTSLNGRVTKRRIYRTAGNTVTFRYEQELADNTTTTANSTKADSALGADMVAGNTSSAGGQIAVAAIAIGGGTTTARKLYRTASGGAAYQLVTTLNDNTTTVYQDNKSDASLGALAPVDLVTELIGIPPTGDGSIRYEIRLGDDVNLLVQCDDVPAQAALAALEGGGSTGIVEHYLQDRRLSLGTATATGNADLTLFARPLITVRYATRDPKTRAGKTVAITLPELSLTGDFTIQSVEIDQIDVAPGLLPRFTVTASSIRFSLEDVLRRLQLAP